MRPFFAVLCAAVLAVPAAAQSNVGNGCDPDNASLILPRGFCAGVYALGLIAPRRMAVASNGDVFVISNAGRGRGGGVNPLRGVVRLRDTNGDGKSDTTIRVADGTGAGILIANNALYTEGGGTTIVRYPFRSNTTELTGAVDTIVSGLPTGGHTTRDFVIRGSDLFVNVGSQGNVCPGGRGTPPADPCPELATRAGIWKFDANKTGQTFSESSRYAKGVRNGTGLVLDPRDNQLYVAQHGRDNLKQWNNNTDEYNAENPGEEFFKVVEGGEYGWPYCYYSHEVKKKVLAPEYGGDGKQEARCATMQQPVYAFPGHWAPNAAFFYTGTQFPAEYRDGVFIAFHGSWNRAPLPQAGFNITFLPMRAGGTATGAHRVFADAFNQAIAPTLNPAGVVRRPSGIAQMNDGSILVSDDQGGVIYRIAYRGQ